MNVQTVFRASEGASSAMQLFTGQAARLSSSVQDGALHQAQLCSFFTLLGAMPHSLKAEADAILGMIRNAREDMREKDNTIPHDTEDGTLLLLTYFVLSCGTASLHVLVRHQHIDVLICTFQIYHIEVDPIYMPHQAFKGLPVHESTSGRLCQCTAGSAAVASFNYMQKADTARMDEVAASSCTEKLLADFEPCRFLPLLLKAAAENRQPDIQVRGLHSRLHYSATHDF